MFENVYYFNNCLLILFGHWCKSEIA